MSDFSEFADAAESRVTRLDAIRAEIQRLAGLEPVEYEIERKEAAKELSISLAFLDAEVTKARPAGGAGDDPAQPAEAVEALAPWPHGVNGAELAEEVRERIARHVVFAERSDVDAAVLWLIGSYLMDTWRLWPKLLISSPTKRCGKSTLLECIEAFACRPMVCANISPAALFRSLDKWHPTLIVDEADRFLASNPELNGILNAGHLRRTAFVNRCVEIGGQQDVARFSVWGAQVIAGIGDQADTLTDRSVVIELRRRLQGEAVERLPVDLFDRMRPIRQRLMRWTADNAETIALSDAEPPECGDDRRRDNWTPLARIAEALGGPWPDRAMVAYAAAGRNDDDGAEPAGVLLMTDMIEIFARRGAERLPAREMLAELLILEERPWSGWARGRPITSHQIARLLRPFGIKSKNMRIGGEQGKAYDRQELVATFSRYTPQKGGQNRYHGNIVENKEEIGTPNGNTKVTVTDGNPEKPQQNQSSYRVTVSTGKSGPEGKEKEKGRSDDDLPADWRDF